MPRFAANLSMMFGEHAFLERFGAAAEAGFDAVEFLFPYAFPAEAVAAGLQEHGLTQALFNLPPGDWDKGERGMASIPGREDEFRASVQQAVPYVRATGVRRVHVMSGHGSLADAAACATYLANVRHAADVMGELGVDVVLEPINPRDMPGYFLSDFNRAAEFVADSGRANVRLQFDIYHRQIMHGDVTMALRAMMPIIGHVQVASVPSRHEPMGEELDDAFLFRELDRLGYAGFVGCEYRPAGGTREGLGWFEAWKPRRR
ncbi:MAG: 2-oxo-tetronate isomerase [Alsobacter sp.]